MVQHPPDECQVVEADMSFRFQIEEASKARPPVIVLVGKMLEGTVRTGDSLTIPLLDGGSMEHRVIAILPGHPVEMVESVSVGNDHAWVGIAFMRSGNHKTDDIELGIAVGVESAPI